MREIIIQVDKENDIFTLTSRETKTGRLLKGKELRLILSACLTMVDLDQDVFQQLD